jgi:hypothetical protein
VSADDDVPPYVAAVRTAEDVLSMDPVDAARMAALPGGIGLIGAAAGERRQARDDLSVKLAEIGERHRGIDCAAVAYLSAGDVPRLLAVIEMLLKAHAPYVSAEEYAAVLTALTGEGKDRG